MSDPTESLKAALSSGAITTWEPRFMGGYLIRTPLGNFSYTEDQLAAFLMGAAAQAAATVEVVDAA